MDFNSYEIDRLLYQKQISLYQRIDDLINKQFDALEADKLAVLTRTMKDLELSIQLYKKGLQNGELFGITYHSNRKPKYEGISLLEIYISI
jgi:hypothetical protein